MNRDGRADVVAATWSHTESRGTAQIIINTRDDWWTSSGTVPLHTWAVSIALADVNNDARLDILTGHRDAVLVTFGDGNDSFTATSSHPLPDFGSGIGVGDFNHDGWADVAVAAWSTRVFSPGFSAFVLVDFDGNGLLDVMNDAQVALNVRDDVNDAPVLAPRNGVTFPYRFQFGEEDLEIGVEATDADLHYIRYEWRTPSEGVISTDQYARLRLPPGRHDVTVTAFDDRGGSDSESFTITVLTEPEIVLRPWSAGSTSRSSRARMACRWIKSSCPPRSTGRPRPAS